MKQLADDATQFFQAWCQHFLLSGKVQIQCKQELPPRCVTPGQLRVIRSQARRGIYTPPRSRRYKVKIAAAVIISRCSLQCMTDPSSKREKTNGRRRAFDQITESQMHVNADEHQMIGNAVYDTTLATFPVGQACELAIRVVERIGANVEHHADNVDAQITIVIKVSRNDAA